MLSFTNDNDMAIATQQTQPNESRELNNNNNNNEEWEKLLTFYASSMQ